MTGPSENQFLLTLGASTAVTFVALWYVNRALGPDPEAPPEVPLGPTLTAGAVGLTLLALLGGCAVVLAGAYGLHRLVGDAMLWWVALALVPASLLPSLVVAKRAVTSSARGSLRLEGDVLVITWDGDMRRWNLAECVASLRRVPSATPGADAALLVLLESPEATLPFVVPLVGIPGSRWLSALALPDGWWEVPEGAAAFPVSGDVFQSRRLVDAMLERVAEVDRG